MRANDSSEVQLTMYFPYERPDGNGNIYTKDAVSNAFIKDLSDIPIILYDKMGEQHPIGMVTSHQCEMEDDIDNSRYVCTIAGVITHSGTSESADLDVDANEIISFEINSIGITLE